MRTEIAERVLSAARLMLIRHGERQPVDAYALNWARFIVEANPLRLPRVENGPTLAGMKTAEQALASRSALELAWMP